jgi:hypothetical protein
LIQIKIDVQQMRSGRIAVELQTGLCKTRPMTKGEAQIACQLKSILALIIADLANMLPGSSMAVGQEDVETLKGLEDLDLDKGENEK